MGSRTITREIRPLIDRIRAAVHAIEPTAQVILYGSRARGDAAPDSDWDLLVLVDGSVSRDRESAINRRLYELELETDAVFSTIVYSKQDWASPLFQAMPFHENVTREGIPL